MDELRQWQKEAYEAFKKNDYKGIVKAATGTGKTILGITFIDDFREDSWKDKSGEKFLIVVPKEDLLIQWYDRIKNHLGISAGRIGAGYNEECDITIAIINSVRLRKLQYPNLILDECHNYLSDVNRLLLENNEFKRIMALSATPDRNDLRTFEKFGLKIIYEYSTEQAIENKDLCEYVILEEPVYLLENENLLYEGYNKTVKDTFPAFGYNIHAVYAAQPSPLKYKLVRAIRKRMEILAKAKNKFEKVVELIIQNPDSKVIVFAQYIYTINLLKKMLYGRGVKSVVYHSKEKARVNELEKFKSNEARVILSARGLDEGLDVPDCDTAIIMAGFKGERQIKQRLGRILRKKDKTAVIYLLYVADSRDEDWLNEMKKYISV